jgi:selenocysteine lyase/cysteine desulfurase
LRELPVKIIGKKVTEGREANVSIRSEGMSSAELTAGLSERGIAAKNGHFYAARLIRSLGFEDPDDGVLRLSFSLYNTMEETEKTLEALSTLLDRKQ